VRHPIASETASFGCPEVRWRSSTASGDAAAVDRADVVAMEMLLTGERIDAARAREIGCEPVVAPKALLPPREQIAERISQNGRSRSSSPRSWRGGSLHQHPDDALRFYARSPR